MSDFIEIEGLGRKWKWPAADEKCRKVVFDWSDDLDVAYKYVRKFETCVQAGGNMGVWPWLLAKRFATVLTFEPDPTCFDCLCANVQEVNVVKHQTGLGAKTGKGRMMFDAKDFDNLGAQYLMPGAEGSVPVVTIDDYVTEACDLIYLDIEGGEIPALRGARETIEKYKPVIVIEDKRLSERFGYKKYQAEAWLRNDFGYEVVARPHRDVVLVCK